jgi:hypothetical protein
MKKLFFTVLLLSNLTFAEEPKITVINKGQEAPYEGLLLNKDAAISLKVEIDSSKELCNISLQKQKDLLIANYDYEKSILINQCERQQKEISIKLESANKEIEIYKKKMIDEELKANSNFWNGTFIGAASGILATSIIGLGIYIFN